MAFKERHQEYKAKYTGMRINWVITALAVYSTQYRSDVDACTAKATTELAVSGGTAR